ncbi:Serine/threonine-protein kinase fray2 [Hypsizygus marmoreus]|uniref:Serine/threonine-protein kinase fray2 n=1 Tax=Hypsizygus marmoreus TaxID=39966 RepID=A0A369KCL3_HYPMA|nr:Serine/threonine-protein kinase fray2 [Hypsizygus marmoreus]
MASITSSTPQSLASTSPIGSHNMSFSSKKFIGAVEDEWQLYSDRELDYTIGAPIGFGASSIVYSASYQPQPVTPSSPLPPPISCALKVLDLDALPPRSLSLLQRETTLMSLSKHPNVLRVRGSWMNGHKLYIALRLMNKGSAADVMRYGWPGGMEEDVVRCILRQALQGLNYLHINGFIHRDVKAANLLIDDDGTVLLGDLGVAADLAEDTSQRISSSSKSSALAVSASIARSDSHPTHSTGSSSGHTGGPKRVVLFDHTMPVVERPRMGKRKSFVGTPCWMAPELIQGRQYDSSADIWSFGITALELTQGRPPRSRETPQRVLLRTIQDDPPTLDRDGGTYKYSRAFKEVVDSCLVKDPSKRPTAQELLETPFFKSAKKKSYLVGAILKDLPPLTLRQERRIANNTQTLHSLDSWDFATTLHSATTSVFRRRALEDMDFGVPGEEAEKCEGVFHMEDEVLDKPEAKQESRRHSRGVSWANEPIILNVQERAQDADPSAPASSPSGSDLSGPAADLSSSPVSSNLSDSSPPSSIAESKTAPEMITSAILPLKDSEELSNTPSHPTSHLLTSISSPSAATSVLSVSSKQHSQGLWRKFKSNVRRPNSRSDCVGDDEKPQPEKREKSSMGSFLTEAGRHVRSMTSGAILQGK